MNDTDLPGPRELLLKGLLKRWVTLKVRGLSLAEFGYMVRCVAYSIRLYIPGGIQGSGNCGLR